MSLTAVVANDADDTIASANNENLTVQTSTGDSAVLMCILYETDLACFL